MARSRGNSWQADVYVPGKGRKRMSFPTQHEAEAFERNAGNIINMPDRAGTVGDVFMLYAEDLWGGSKDWRNCERITKELITRLGPNTRVNAIDESVIETLTEDLKRENKPATVNTKLTRLSKLLKKAVKKKLISSIPPITLLKGQGKRVRFLTDREERNLFSGMPTEAKALSWFLLYSGCRYSEAIKLRWCDVDDGRKATFWETKGNTSRTVPLARKARASLRWARRINPDWEGPFSRIPYWTYRSQWVRAKKLASLSSDAQVTPHVLRHTCASRLVQRGVSITRVQKFLGHSTLEMTLRYAHLAPDDLEIAAQVLEAV